MDLNPLILESTDTESILGTSDGDQFNQKY
jgi:hypothetical protein